MFTECISVHSRRLCACVLVISLFTAWLTIYTYERDDGFACSWIDHNIICSCTVLFLSCYGSLFFLLSVLLTVPCIMSGQRFSLWLWYNMVSQHLPLLTSDTNSTSTECSYHRHSMNMFNVRFLPCLIVLTNDFPLTWPLLIESLLAGMMGLVRSQRLISILAQGVSEEAGCPSSGVLFTIKRSTKSR